MKKPWIIVLLSIVPGLGLLLLGEIRKAIAASFSWLYWAPETKFW